MKRKLLYGLFSCILFLSMTVFVRANSALTNWNGTDAAGILTADEDCPIVVEHETLTFTLSDGGKTADRFAAEYTFHNPSDLQIEAELSFPFGGAPGYYRSEGPYDNTSLYHVFLNGEEITPQVRYTFIDYRQFDVEKDLKLLQDTYREDPFFHPGLAVYEYRLHFETDPTILDQGFYINTSADLKNSPEQVRYLFDTDRGGYQTGTEGSRIMISLDEAVQDVVLYTFGEEVQLDWSYQTTEKEGKETDGSCQMEKARQLTYEEFLREKQTEEEILPIDYYNAVTDYFNLEDTGKIFLPRLEYMEQRLMKWFRYTLTFAPGETLTNTVEAPSYPYIDAGYEDEVYGYRYLLSPASTWREFKGLQVNVVSGWEMLKSTPAGFEKTETGYTAIFDHLPEEELYFEMCRVADPKRKANSVVILILVILGFSLLLFLLFCFLVYKLLKFLFGKKQ